MQISRTDEAEADRRGIALMARSGYNPNTAPEAMLVVKRSSSGKNDPPALLRDHPAPEERIRRERAREDGLPAISRNPRGSTLLREGVH